MPKTFLFENSWRFWERVLVGKNTKFETRTSDKFSNFEVFLICRVCGGLATPAAHSFPFYFLWFWYFIFIIEFGRIILNDNYQMSRFTYFRHLLDLSVRKGVSEE